MRTYEIPIGNFVLCIYSIFWIIFPVFIHSKFWVPEETIQNFYPEKSTFLNNNLDFWLALFATPSVDRIHSFNFFLKLIFFRFKCSHSLMWSLFEQYGSNARTSEQIKFNGIANHYVWKLLAIHDNFVQFWQVYGIFFHDRYSNVSCCCFLHVQCDDLMTHFCLFLCVCVVTSVFNERAFAVLFVRCAITPTRYSS